MARSFLPDNSASPRYDAQRGPGELAEQQIPSGKVQGAARILLSSDSLGDAPAGSRDPLVSGRLSPTLLMPGALGLRGHTPRADRRRRLSLSRRWSESRTLHLAPKSTVQT